MKSMIAPAVLALALFVFTLSAGAQTEKLNVPPGFKAVLIYSVPNDTQGAWISICFDDKGRIITSDEYTKLFRVKVPALDAKVAAEDVEMLDVPVGRAQGLVHAFGSLYVVQNGKPSGLYRLTDTNEMSIAEVAGRRSRVWRPAAVRRSPRRAPTKR